MPGLMMGSRELRHVPADFDCPIGTTWPGWFMPSHLEAIRCADCDGDGGSPAARWLQSTFYDHNVSGAPGWCHSLTPGDVDALVREGRWGTAICGRSLPTAKHPKGRWQRMSVPTSLEDAQAAQDGSGGGMFSSYSIDGINLWILVRDRCRRLGAPVACATCSGVGHSFRDEEHKRLHDEWNPQPPTGDHIQLWQTVSEGGPVSPVFPDTPAGRVDLARWLDAHDTSITSSLGVADWLRVFEGVPFFTDVADGAPVFGEVA